MGKEDIVPGSSTIAGFFGWMNERHAIWRRRFIDKLPKPWTQDEIMLDYKFTNVFRQLDKGTLALNKMLEAPCNALRALYSEPMRTVEDQELALTMESDLVFNIMWYRFFNLEKHASDLGWIESMEMIRQYMGNLHAHGQQIFTGCHMTTGCPGEDKVDSYLRACQEAFDDSHIVVQACKELNTMQGVFNTLKQFYMVGGFVAYEMTCDLRFTPLLENAKDRFRWANVGPGAKRGMTRLGLTPQNESMVLLHRLAVTTDRHPVDYFSSEELIHCSEQDIRVIDKAFKDGCKMNPDLLNAPVPFEIREIEHSLCEFDKYERVRLGQGRPRSKYKGRE